MPAKRLSPARLLLLYDKASRKVDSLTTGTVLCASPNSVWVVQEKE